MSGGLDAVWLTLERIFDVLSDQQVFGCVTLGLALVFVLSALPKLRKPELAALAMVDFGVARRSHRWAGLSVGIGELLLAVALGVAAAGGTTALRVVPTSIAAMVLWIFAGLIARALRSSEPVSCFCFGNAEATISLGTLFRTMALAVVATILSTAALAPVSSPAVQTWMLELTTAASLLGTGALLAALPSTREVPHECS